MIKIPKIQYITRDDSNYSHAEQARIMFENDIKWVQIRMKNTSMDEVLEQAKIAMVYAHQHEGTLIINDSIEIAQKVKAHGIHLGLKDTPVDEARKIMGNKVIIGGTANTIEDIQMQVAKSADYVGLGPFRFTNTKKNLSPIIGLAGYKEIKRQLLRLTITTPIVAVGGILETDIEEIMKTGMDGIAISGALFIKILKQ